MLEEERHVVDAGRDRRGRPSQIALGPHGLDIIVLDIGLPDISGLDVARRLHPPFGHGRAYPHAHRPRHRG